ncbi:hypothetical protein FPQ18DRAFT_389292 [Pyronema domesticum]|nr:hypothetical protein FPQ18DRAFT_389292 [Pyronema domesticum]
MATALPPQNESAEPKTHTLTCHCERGVIIFFLPEEQITFTSGGFEDMGCYEFAKKVLQFRFCKKCGSTPIANRKEGGTWGLNAKCVEGLDVSKLEIIEYDGRSK